MSTDALDTSKQAAARARRRHRLQQAALPVAVVALQPHEEAATP